VAFLLAIIIYTSLAFYIQSKNDKVIEELKTKIEVLQKPTQILNSL
jgi:septation ring formation regulator EzrA